MTHNQMHTCGHTHAHVRTHTCAHPWKHAGTDSHLPQFDCEYCPISASFLLVLISPRPVPVPTVVLLTGGRAGPSAGWISTASSLNKGEPPGEGGCSSRLTLARPSLSPRTLRSTAAVSSLGFCSQRGSSFFHIPCGDLAGEKWAHGAKNSVLELLNR